MKRRRDACGFTVMEVTVVSAAMAVLVMIVSAAWRGMGRPIADMIVRCHVIEEIDLATDSLARDLGGSLSNGEGRQGSKNQGRFVGWMLSGDSQLLLCFDGSDAPNGQADWGPPDTVIAYLVDDGRLVRWDQTANTMFTVAQNVDRLEVHPVGDTLQIQLTFRYRNLTRTCTFVARTP
jgi:type II secretory pathway component PulJ